ncbi:hypothetical protein HNP84_005402 [Thermocatellispora tengchongensis]|uniref:Tachylectin 2 domain-containing protein n=1 Tax=Thermocatellispora tengchongensis TaxID=1073253 RepID=A0A840P7L2_9ACTN|nr:N,N-dimethylformamidase beta subunit family domain-containing protein [Thermocatellispora tengchongensis]MBB5135658.1 hypothetical protein [Thermocatellispora tengchongensis]
MSQVIRRRRLLQGAAALVGAAAVHAALPQAARAASSDPRQRFIQLTASGAGAVYGIEADGTLLWFRHTGWETGRPEWSPGVGRAIGTGFHEFETVLAGDDGQLFGVCGDGRIRWYRYVVTDPATGDGRWANGGGPVIGTGFDRFPEIFGGRGGVLYARDTNGALWWYQYLAGDGTAGPGAWANGGTGVRIGDGFKPYMRLLAGPSGVILGLRNGGNLHWWRYRADTGRWEGGGNAVDIGGGWGEGGQKHVFAGDGGVIYAVATDEGAVPGDDDTLVWYRLTNATTVAADGRAIWANGGSRTVVGKGFSIERTGALQGYPITSAIRQGTRAGFAISATTASVTAAVVRHTGEGAPAVVRAAAPVAGGLQMLPEGYRRDGCGWAERFGFTVPADWQSGVYSVRLSTTEGLRRHVPFVVRPARPQAAIAVLLPTNTYNAYNHWGGHNQYTVGEAGRRRTVTFHRPTTSMEVEDDGRISHTLYSDLLLLRWMTGAGIAYDCYTDQDLHADPGWLGQYRALVLGSHPEYWSQRMRQTVVSYLDGGGRVVYTGGNGLYERMDYTSDGTAALHRTANGDRDVFGAIGLSEAQILGVELGPAYMDFHPYRVVSAHPLLEGTGLRPGDTFGGRAFNGAASGWEVDIIPRSGTPGAQIIAQGDNPAGGAAMLYLPKANGGWVFSAGSISFNGALPYDAAIGRIMRNVLARAAG